MLEVRDLDVRYNQIQAVDGFSMDIEEGEVVALVGPNGAGKTSTMMAISGVVRPAQGRISFLGERIDQLPPHEIVRRGIMHVPEGRMIFNEMTVRENLLLGAYTRATDSQITGDMEHILELFPVLRERYQQRAGNLSGGQMQMLAIARGLLSRPKLLLLDEPSLGLAPLIVEELFAFIRRLHEMGTTILLVEQNVQQALNLANRAYLLEAGHLVEAGPAQHMLRSERVMQSYLGVGMSARV